MEFKNIVKERYAVKKFDSEKKVSQENLSELLEMVKLSASSFGLQPFKVIVVEDKETKEKLLPASFNQEQITTSSHVLVFCAYTDVMDRIEIYETMMKENGAPEESITGYINVMKGFLERMNEEQKLIWAQKQVYIALGNGLNGSKALGFESCPMEGFNPVEYSKILNLPGNLIPSVVMPIGYPADTKRNKIRYGNEDLFLFHK